MGHLPWHLGEAFAGRFSQAPLSLFPTCPLGVPVNSACGQCFFLSCAVILFGSVSSGTARTWC